MKNRKSASDWLQRKMLSQGCPGTSKETGEPEKGTGKETETTHAKGMGTEFSGDYSPVGKSGASRDRIF